MTQVCIQLTHPTGPALWFDIHLTKPREVDSTPDRRGKIDGRDSANTHLRRRPVQ